MGDVLSIVAIVVLLALIAVSVRKQRLGMAQARAVEDSRAEGGDVQHQRSLRQRAEVRAAARDDH